MSSSIIRKSGDKIALIHTQADLELKEKSPSSAVVEKTLHYLAENNIILLPSCPYVFAYIKKHPIENTS